MSPMGPLIFWGLVNVTPPHPAYSSHPSCSIPISITVDSGRQFIDKRMKDYYNKLRISLHKTSFTRPQVQWIGRTVSKQMIQTLRKKTKDAKGTWVNELPRILWSLTISVKTSICHTSFMLTYGSEDLIHLEVGQTNISIKRHEPP